MCDLAAYLKENGKKEQAYRFYSSADRKLTDHSNSISGDEYTRLKGRIDMGKASITNPFPILTGTTNVGQNQMTLKYHTPNNKISKLNKRAVDEVQNLNMFPNIRGAEKRLGLKKGVNPLYSHTPPKTKGGKKRTIRCRKQKKRARKTRRRM